MQRRTAVLSGLIATGILAAGVVVGCAGNSPINVDKATPTPSGSPVLPSAAVFNSNIEPFIDGAGNACGQSTACHASGTANGLNGHPLVIAAGDSSGNYSHFACNPRITAYNPPAGQFLNHFCTGSGAPIGGGHQGNIASAQNCTDFYNWAMGGSGGVPTCSP